MSIPKCEECLRKHLSDSISLGKEVMNGHSAGGNPDHRSDFSGEMIEAEKHASLLDKTLSLKIRYLRRTLQAQRWKPTEADIEKIRVFWHVSFVIKGKEELSKIEAEDKELFESITQSIQKYAGYSSTDDQTDIAKSCSCEGKPKPSLKNEVYGNKTYILCPSDEELDESFKLNIRSNIIGFEAIMRVPKSFEKWPKDFIEENGKALSEAENFIICMWPKNVIAVRRTNALAFPSIVSELRSLSESDTIFCEKALGITPTNFYAVPVYVSVPMLLGLCEDYEKLTGKKEIGDIYSLIRNFDNSPAFDNRNSIVVSNIDDKKEKTLFVVS